MSQMPSSIEWEPLPVRIPVVRRPGKLPRESMSSLLDVQNRMIQRYFHLQRAEQRLSRKARGTGAGPGRKAIQQIELERQRLGRDLHTGIGQILAATRLQVETIEQQWPTPPPQVRAALDRIAELAALALDQVRAVSRRLHPPEWQRLSLRDAVSQLWDLSGLPEHTEAHFAIADGLPEPALETKIVLYRALQEALANIAGHASATSVSVTLEAKDGRSILTVQDNGKGFDALAFWNSPAHLNAGLGLRAIREQTIAIGGGLSVHSDASGTTVEVWVPDSEQPAAW
jgi:two-component system, NarL family, sensor kinase